MHGSSLASPAFQRLVYVALRALIDELGVQTFNAAIHNIQLLPAGGTERGAAASAASVMGGPGGSSSSSSSAGSVAGNGSTGGAAAAMGAFDARGRPLPVRARIVSRGKLSNGASDFGGLEVFGGASIGGLGEGQGPVLTRGCVRHERLATACFNACTHHPYLPASLQATPTPSASTRRSQRCMASCRLCSDRRGPLTLEACPALPTSLGALHDITSHGTALGALGGRRDTS